jgi:hypothetical protein
MFKMLYTDTRISTTPMEVVVYDFLHVSPEQSYALCWNTKSKYWLTVPINMLVPVIKKGLNE